MKNIVANGNLYGEQITIKQISKVAAKKLFAEGKEVYLQSSNMMPFNLWQGVCPIKLDNEQLKSSIEYYNWCLEGKYQLPVYSPNANGQFESIVNNYSYYNCDNERGKYIHFYTKVN